MTQLMETHISCVYQLLEGVRTILSKVTLKADKNLSKFLHNFESLTEIQLKFFTRIMHYSYKRYHFETKHIRAPQV